MKDKKLLIQLVAGADVLSIAHQKDPKKYKEVRDTVKQRFNARFAEVINPDLNRYKYLVNFGYSDSSLVSVSTKDAVIDELVKIYGVPENLKSVLESKELERDRKRFEAWYKTTDFYRGDKQLGIDDSVIFAFDHINNSYAHNLTQCSYLGFPVEF